MSYVVREANRSRGSWELRDVASFESRIDAISFAAECACEELLYDGPNAGVVAGFEVVDKDGEICDQYDTSQGYLNIWHA